MKLYESKIKIPVTIKLNDDNLKGAIVRVAHAIEAVKGLELEKNGVRLKFDLPDDWSVSEIECPF